MASASTPSAGFHLENCRRGGKYRILDAEGGASLSKMYDHMISKGGANAFLEGANAPPHPP